MMNLSRRGFIKTGITGAAGIAITPSVIQAATPVEEDNVIYRVLGKTGMKVPVISFGVMRSDNPALCKAAYEKGIKLFDTANGYQNGNNETMLGNVLKNVSEELIFSCNKSKTCRHLQGRETIAGNH